MAKVIRLTESDLTRLVKRVINEHPYGANYNVRGSKGFNRIQGASKREVDIFLENLPEDTMFIQISDCEYADFSNIDICAFPKLTMINLKGTENNFDEQNYDCPYNEYSDGIYDFTPDY
jgi:hypothetical protein